MINWNSCIVCDDVLYYLINHVQHLTSISTVCYPTQAIELCVKQQVCETKSRSGFTRTTLASNYIMLKVSKESDFKVTGIKKRSRRLLG